MTKAILFLTQKIPKKKHFYLHESHKKRFNLHKKVLQTCLQKRQRDKIEVR